MKKRFLAVVAMAGILALSACEQGSLMDELEQDTELNREAEPPDDIEEDEDGGYNPPTPPEKGG